MGNFNNSAVVEEDRITETTHAGGYDIYDLSKRPQPEASLRAPVIMQAMQEMRRFYAE